MASVQDRIAVTGRPIFILGGLLLAFGYYYMNGSPTAVQDKQNQALKTQIAATEAKIKEAEDRLANKAKFQEEMEKLSQTFRLALEYLPKDLDIQDILRKTYLEARSAGVELSSFTPKESSSKDFYEEVPLDIKLRGPYGQLVTFLANVSKLPRIINVRDIEISNPKFTDGIPVMNFSGTLVVYRYKEGK